MPFPANAKTWQFNVNQILVAQATNAIQTQVLLKAIKDTLKGFAQNPWTVQYSSNAGNNGAGSAASGAAGTAGDLVDRWSVADQASGAGSTNDVNFAAAGSRHAWMVLRQTGIATNFEICIDCNVNAVSQQVTLVVSPSAAFTGGSVTARPTATDETVMFSAATFYGTAQARSILHAWQSTDGQCTRINLWSQGQTNSLFWILDKPQSPVTGWTNPSIFCMIGNGGSTFTNLGTGTPIKMRGAGGTPNFGGTFTEERWNNGTQMRTQNGIGTCPNTFSNEWPVFPIGIAANATGNGGRLGNVYDLWWKPIGINNGDTMQTDLTARNYVALGDLILPWKGDSTVPLLA